MRLVSFLWAMLLWIGPASAADITVTIDNTAPRRDETGAIVDAHDGALEFFAGRFYLYGTKYGTTDGLHKTNSYVVYSSADLKTWRFENTLLPDAPPRIYFRPYVKFNKRTGKYVLWYNADDTFGVAVSDVPQGPFTIVNPDVPVKFSSHGVGDFGLFVDDDGIAYLAYTTLDLKDIKMEASAAPPHHRISVERLRRDYLGSTFLNSGFIAGNVESPAMFKRQGTYYILFDNTCAFCKAGSGARVYRAHHPLGRFRYQDNINVAPGTRNQGHAWTPPASGRANATVKAQQAHVAQFPTPDGPQFVWVGDRWKSNTDGVKGHDLQAWIPLRFDGQKILPMRDHAQWDVTLRLPGDSQK